MCAAARSDTSNAAASVSSWVNSSSDSSIPSSTTIRATSCRKASTRDSGECWGVCPDSVVATSSATSSAMRSASAGSSWTSARTGSLVAGMMGRWAALSSFASAQASLHRLRDLRAEPFPRLAEIPRSAPNLTSPAEADPAPCSQKAPCPQEALPLAVFPPASP